MAPANPLKTGDEVTIECAGRTLRGVVALASSNGRSLALTFEGLGVYRSIVTNAEVRITNA